MSPSTDARPSVIYECPECETRYLNERRCPDCQLFTRRIGPGGTCPHCDGACRPSRPDLTEHPTKETAMHHT